MARVGPTAAGRFAPLRSTARRLRGSVGVALVVAAAGAAATAWDHWLDTATPSLAPLLGVALAALLLLEPRRWAWPVAGAAAGALAVELGWGTPTARAAGLVAAAVIAAVLAALALRWFSRGRFGLHAVRDVVALMVLGVGVGAVVAAGLATAVTALTEGHGDLWTYAHRALLADALGVIVVVPPALAWIGYDRSPLPSRSSLELGALTASVGVMSVLAFRVWTAPLAFAGLLLLLWAALRFGTRGVSGAALVMFTLAAWATARGEGPVVHASGSAADAALLLQSLVGATLVTVLCLAVALEERDVARVDRRVATERFRRTFDRTPVGMAVTTPDHVVVDANPVLCELLGYSRAELVGRSLDELRHAPGAEAAGPEPAHDLLWEQRIVTATGAVRWVDVREARVRGAEGRPEQRIVIVQDLTQRKGLEEQLLHAQKMEAVGRLAGGIAHDFNNVLAVMRGQVELLQDDLALLEQAQARVTSVQRATDRAAALTDDLLAFSRRRPDEPVPVDLHEVITSLGEMLQQLVGDSISICFQLDAVGATVRADRNRIEQAVVNLAVNARDAMPRGGTLTISTRDAGTVADGGGGCVVLSVTDTGLGIDPDAQPHIFEPFFTTKPPGVGTGLGLSTTYEIVHRSGGTITVASALGRGTRFDVTLPTIDEARDPSGPLAVPATSPAAPETILVVDDEPDVCAVVAETLRGSGYRVLQAFDAETALELATRSETPIDLLVSDVVMPGMGGPELAERITADSPGTQVVFLSGYAEVAHRAPALRGAPLLTKPLRRSRLLSAVRGALAVHDAAPPARGRRALRARSGSRRPAP